jgi:sulfur relay (sulfurtransferase) DsrC/TusE family protein
MTKEEIIRMAREAELNAHGLVIDRLERFAALVSSQNRSWVGLTDEEIKSLRSWWPSYEDAPALLELVKDVEAKLREKNGG